MKVTFNGFLQKKIFQNLNKKHPTFNLSFPVTQTIMAMASTYKDVNETTRTIA